MPDMRIGEYKDLFSKIEKDYALFEKQFLNSYVRGTGSEEEEREKLARMASLYEPSLKILQIIDKYTFSYDKDGNREVKNPAFYEQYQNFLKKHPYLEEFKESAQDGMKLKEVEKNSFKQATMAKKKAITRGERQEVEKYKNAVFMSSEDNTLTDEQKKGIAEFERWLYRNCDKTGLKLRGGGKSKRDFANEFVKLPAREKLNALYILQNKKGLTELTEKEKQESQTTFVPNLTELKDKIISNKLKFWKRFSGEQFKWAKIQQAVQLSKQKEEELKKYTFDIIDEQSEFVEIDDDFKIKYEKPKITFAKDASEKEEALERKPRVDRDKLTGGKSVQEEIKVDDISSNFKQKLGNGAGNLSLGLFVISMAESAGQFVYDKFRPIAQATKDSIAEVSTYGSVAMGALSLLSEGIKLSDIENRISKMSEVVKNGKKKIAAIAKKLNLTNEPKEFDGFVVVPSDEFENITDKQISEFNEDDKELYELGLAIKNQINIAKQDYQEAVRHEEIAEKKVALNVDKTIISGLAFLPGATIPTMAAGAGLAAYDKWLDHQNEELNREDHRQAFDKKVHTELMVDKAKENIKARKKFIKNSKHEEAFDKYLANDKAIKDKIRSEIATENNYVDVREWYRADKGGQIIQLINLKDRYKDNELGDDVAVDANNEKKEYIKSLKKDIAKTSTEMLKAMGKSEESGRKQQEKLNKSEEGKEKTSINELEKAEKSETNSKKIGVVSKVNSKDKSSKEAGIGTRK